MEWGRGGVRGWEGRAGPGRACAFEAHVRKGWGRESGSGRWVVSSCRKGVRTRAGPGRAGPGWSGPAVVAAHEVWDRGGGCYGGYRRSSCVDGAGEGRGRIAKGRPGQAMHFRWAAGAGYALPVGGRGRLCTSGGRPGRLDPPGSPRGAERRRRGRCPPPTPPHPFTPPTPPLAGAGRACGSRSPRGRPRACPARRRARPCRRTSCRGSRGPAGRPPPGE